MEKKLYIGNLPYSTTESELRDLFAQAGDVESCSLVMDRETNRPRGFAFVEMGSEAEAAQAIEQFNEYELDGRRLVVNEARPREPRGGGGFGGGGGGGYGGGGGGGGNFRGSNKGSRRNVRQQKRDRKSGW